MFNFFRARRRRQLLGQDVPAAWRAIVARNVAVFRRLSAAQQSRLLATVRIIAAERHFEGCQGLAVTEEMRVTIAAQAALLILGAGDYYFDRVAAFLIYPTRMIVPPRNIRLADEEDDIDRVLLGQASHERHIVLSWPDVLRGGRRAADGENVVLHELAHHLDGLDGEMGGSPPVASTSERDRWREVLEGVRRELQRDLAADRPTLLLDGAAENAAEVFAYGSECFFEQPWQLGAWHPELFDLLHRFYQVDPREWFSKPPAARLGPDSFRGDWPEEDADADSPGESAAELPPLKTADQYFTRGYDYLQQERYELAEADFNQAVRLAPDDQEALVYRAEARQALGHFEAALADADRACRLEPDDLAARRVRGLARVALGHYETGLSDLDAALAGDSGEPHIDSIFYCGVARAQLGEHRRAIADFSRVIRLQPADAEAWHERGLCRQALGEHDAAVVDFAEAKRLGWSADIPELGM